MGSGQTAQRIVYGQTMGESLAIREHTLAMLPILEQQADIELKIQEKEFEQQLEQAKKIKTLVDQQTESAQPVYVTQTAEQAKQPNYLLYVAIGAAALLFFTMRKKR